jgi:hypothetical protein
VRATAVQVVAERTAAAIPTATAVLERAWEIATSDDRDRVPALNVAKSYFPEFRDGPLVDQSQHVHLPEGLTVEELRALAGPR